MGHATSEIVRLLADYEELVEPWLTWCTSCNERPTTIGMRVKRFHVLALSHLREAEQLHFDENSEAVASLMDDLQIAVGGVRDLVVGEEDLESFLAHAGEVARLSEHLVSLGAGPAAETPTVGTAVRVEKKGGLDALVQAMAEESFRRRVKENPDEALAVYDLTPEEKAAIKSGNTVKLRELGVDERITRSALYLKDISRTIDEEIEKLTSGRALFNPPEDMRLGVTERVVVRISKTLTDDLATSLKGRGVPHTESIKVGTFMKVRLAGAAFQIESLSSEEQPVPATGFTEWSWNVKPMESGLQVLSLAIAVRIKLPDHGEETYDSPVLDRKIRVRVSPVHSTVSFVRNNWRWMVTTAVGSGVVWHFLGPKSK